MNRSAGLWLSRNYERGDEEKIRELFRVVFGKEMDLRVWWWRFVENPFGHGVIRLQFDGEKLVGHYAVAPVVLKVGDALVKAVFSMTTMTHPEYQGRGIFTTLAREAYDESLRQGGSLVYGFPNRNSYYGFTQKLGWLGFGNVSVWGKQVGPEEISQSSLEGVVRRVDQFGDEVDRLWEKVKDNYIAIVPRTSPYLNWRFVRNPQAQYCIVVRPDGEGGITGYVVLKTYRSADETKGHVVDMWSVNDPAVVGDLLHYAHSYFVADGVQDISCFCPDGGVWADVLHAEGFVRHDMEATYFGVLPLNLPDESMKIVQNPTCWYLTMGDSDVY